MVKCKKIVFERLSGKTPVVVLGVILEEGKHRCKFRTSKKEYSIAWSKIWSIEDTEEDFKLQIYKEMRPAESLAGLIILYSI